MGRKKESRKGRITKDPGKNKSAVRFGAFVLSKAA
jgi:hypothetical protein